MVHGIKNRGFGYIRVVDNVVRSNRDMDTSGMPEISTVEKMEIAKENMPNKRKVCSRSAP